MPHWLRTPGSQSRKGPPNYALKMVRLPGVVLGPQVICFRRSDFEARPPECSYCIHLREHHLCRAFGQNLDRLHRGYPYRWSRPGNSLSRFPGAGRYYSTDAYGLRYVVGGSADSTHVVQIVCQNPGTSGCYVDWIGSNGAAKRPDLPPYVWTGVSYTTLQPVPVDGFLKKQQEVRAIVSELKSDGLPIRVADIASVFNMPATPECSGDGVHPNVCGNQIEESVWLSAMSFLATEAQRIDVGQNSQLVVGVPLTLQATATSGLPLKYSIMSGDATVSGNQLTTQNSATLLWRPIRGRFRFFLRPPLVFLDGGAPNHNESFQLWPNANPGASVTLTATVTSNGKSS